VASKKGGLITRFVKQVLRKDLVTDDSQRGLMRLALARLLLEENNPKDASSQATSALEDDDSLAGEAYAIIGLAAADDGSADEAIEALEKSQAAHHKSTRLFRTLAKLYRDRKDYPKARAAAERAVDGDKENSTLWLEVAALRRLAGDTDAVAPALLQAIRFDETNAHAYSRLARVYLDQGKTDEAVKTAEKASSIAPDDVSVLVSLGRALLANDHPSESLKPLKKARKNAKPKSKSAWESAFYLGSALIQVDKRDEGMRMISEALRGQPDPALHLKAAAIALNEAESPNKAATILSKLIKSEPDNYEARVLMAEALAQRAHGRSKYDTGIRKHLNAAIKLNDTRRDAPMALGKHEFESLRPTKAIEAFDLGLRGNRRDKDLLFYKGWACIRAGRWDDAISALQLCLQVAPNFEDAKAKLEEAQEGKFYQRD
jgi:tetratricopeptide (TPR) repeat protein